MRTSTEENFKKELAERYRGPTPCSHSLSVGKCASPVCRIKAYESKIATLTIIHAAVQKENDTLRSDLKQAQQPGGVTEEEVLELKEEFSRRLGTADQTIVRLQASKSGMQYRHCKAKVLLKHCVV